MTARKLKVHPAVEAWPMIDDEDLDALAADIKANGLIHPVVLDGDGLVLDGRNRVEACKRAGVELMTTLYEGDDPMAFMLSANAYRRHMSVGARAVAIVRMVSLSDTKIGRGEKLMGVSQPRLSEARTVLEWAPGSVDAARTTSLPLIL